MLIPSGTRSSSPVQATVGFSPSWVSKPSFEDREARVGSGSILTVSSPPRSPLSRSQLTRCSSQPIHSDGRNPQGRRLRDPHKVSRASCRRCPFLADFVPTHPSALFCLASLSRYPTPPISPSPSLELVSVSLSRHLTLTSLTPVRPMTRSIFLFCRHPFALNSFQCS